MEVVVAMLLQAGHEAWIKWIVEVSQSAAASLFLLLQAGSELTV